MLEMVMVRVMVVVVVLLLRWYSEQEAVRKTVNYWNNPQTSDHRRNAELTYILRVFFGDKDQACNSLTTPC